ncbi:hypothetical protein HMPREF9503_01925 [Enterococcus faecalis TX0043]|nr:hypothetical protein HMPREF9503_01925 [Enterococcus faecalis TX0043]
MSFIFDNSHLKKKKECIFMKKFLKISLVSVILLLILTSCVIVRM